MLLSGGMKPHSSPKPFILAILFITLSLSLSGCFSKGQLISDSASGLFKEIASSANRQSDVALVRQALPSYLLLIDGLIQSYPDNQNLLLAGAQAYVSFASLLDEQETNRAALLIQKGKGYALKALELDPLFKGTLEGPVDAFRDRLAKADTSKVSLLFNVGSIWGTWIAQGPDSVEGMADLPKVEAIIDRLLQLGPDYYYGGPHLFKAILLSARPVQFGGNLDKANEHFQQALKDSQGKFLMTSVYYAQYYAKQRLDRELFTKTLNGVLNNPADTDPDLTLMKTLAQEKARKLLSQADEFF
jgi:hypothetical protein